MNVTDTEVILNDVILFNNFIYTKESILAEELKSKFYCRNFYNITSIKNLELTKQTVTEKIDKPCVVHYLGHANTNIGHYFNEHLFSFVRSMLIHDGIYLSLYESDAEDCFTSNKMATGNLNWGASILKCLNFKKIVANKNIAYEIKELILPRESRWLTPYNNSSDELLFIRNQILSTINPTNTEPYTVLFNKKSDRNIANDRELINYLNSQQKHLKVIEDFRTLSFTDVVQLLHNADVFIAPWGSHLTNALFMKPFSTVYELHPLNMRDRWWSTMQTIFKKRCNINYINVPCKYVEHENEKRENIAVSVDVSLFKLN